MDAISIAWHFFFLSIVTQKEHSHQTCQYTVKLKGLSVKFKQMWVDVTMIRSASQILVSCYADFRREPSITDWLTDCPTLTDSFSKWLADMPVWLPFWLTNTLTLWPTLAQWPWLTLTQKNSLTDILTDSYWFSAILTHHLTDMWLIDSVVGTVTEWLTLTLWPTNWSTF